MGIPAPLGVMSTGLPPLGDQANAVKKGAITAVGPHRPFAFRGPMNLAIWNSVTSALTTTAGSLAATVVSATGLQVGTAINSVNVPKGTTIGALNGTNITLAVPPVTFYASQINTSNGQVTLPAGSNVASLVGSTVTVPSNAEQVTLPANTTVTAVVQADIAPSANGPGQPGIIQLSATPTVAPPINTQVPLVFAVGAAAILTSGADAAASFTDAATKWNGTVQLERSFDGGSTFLCANIGSAGLLAQFISLSSVQTTFGEPEKSVLYRLNCIAYVSGTINYRISQTGGAAESLAIGPLTGG